MHEANVVATELARRIRSKVKLWTGTWYIRISLASLALLLLIALVVHRYSPKTDVADCAFRITESAAAPETKGDAFRLDTCIRLEEASTNSQRTLGLSGRASMGQNKGMVFDFGGPAEYCMWMRDMNFDLDMIWLNEQKEIVYMIEGVTPDTYPKSFCGPESARYVVEVNSGIVKAGDLHVGQRLNF
jgi:uncharacterized membrane protein (UPF0127 family)